MKIKFYIFIFCFLFTNCEIKSTLKKNTNNNVELLSQNNNNIIHSLCIVNEINNNNDKILINEMNHLINNIYDVNKINNNLDNCEYLLTISSLQPLINDIVDISGTMLHKKLTLTVQYYLFKINKEKITSLLNIINQPIILQDERISNKLRFFSGTREGEIGNMIKNTTLYSNIFQDNVLKIKESHEKIYYNAINDYIFYQSNPYLLLSTVQAKNDNMEFMAKNLARKIINTLYNVSEK